MRHRRQAPKIAGICLLAVGLAGALVIALLPAARGWHPAVLPPLIPDAVVAMSGVIHALRLVSIPLVCGLVFVLLVDRLSALRSQRKRLLNRLAGVEFSGLDQVQTAKPPRRLSFFRGTALATLAIVLVGVTSGIEGEITEGPLRPVDALFGLVGPGEHTLLLQSPKLTFMDDSAIPSVAMDHFAAAAPFAVMPFGKHLLNINDGSALELSIPDTAYAQLTDTPGSGGCSSASIAVDNTVHAGVGETVTVNGVHLRVVKVLAGVAQINRSVGIIARSTLVNCIDPAARSSYFGALAAPSSVATVDAATSGASLPAVAVSEVSFKENNRNFWRANATPLLLQIILYLALFSAFAAAGERQSQLQRNVRELGILNAAGVDFRTLWAIERRRAMRTTLIAGLIACPVMVPVAAAFNATELGVHIGVGPTEFAVGISLTLVSMLTASFRAIRQFERGLDLPLAVKG